MRKRYVIQFLMLGPPWPSDNPRADLWNPFRGTYYQIELMVLGRRAP